MLAQADQGRSRAGGLPCRTSRDPSALLVADLGDGSDIPHGHPSDRKTIPRGTPWTGTARADRSAVPPGSRRRRGRSSAGTAAIRSCLRSTSRARPLGSSIRHENLTSCGHAMSPRTRLGRPRIRTPPRFLRRELPRLGLVARRIAASPGEARPERRSDIDARSRAGTLGDARRVHRARRVRRHVERPCAYSEGAVRVERGDALAGAVRRGRRHGAVAAGGGPHRGPHQHPWRSRRSR